VSGWQETEYGKAPSDWRVLPLADISVKITDGAHLSPRPQSAGKYMCSVKDMTYNKFDLKGSKLISEVDYESLVKQGCQPKKGDILISKDGANCLDLIFIFNQSEDIVLLSSIAIVRLLPDFVPEYVRYFLLSPDCQYTMRNNYVSGSAIPRVVLKDFKKVPILVPPLEEQKSIASVLTSLDDKIDLLHRQNKTLEAMAETLFRQWFVEGAGDWDSGSLADVAVNVKDAVTASNIAADSNYIGLEHIDRRNIALNQNGFGSDVSSNKYAFAKNDILFGKLRPYFHKVCFAPFQGICSTDILVVRPKRSELFAYCLFAFFQNDVVEYANLGSGGTRMPRTDWGTLKTYPILIPDSGTVKRFNEVSVPSIEKIASNIEQIKSLEKLRDGLLPKLMNGDVRVAHA
jgi:type I restriction enzyme S subunit